MNAQSISDKRIILYYGYSLYMTLNILHIDLDNAIQIANIAVDSLQEMFSYFL